MDEQRAVSQNIRPLHIAILNLMPLKEDTELDLLRVLSNFPIQTEITLMKMELPCFYPYQLRSFKYLYVNFSSVKDEYFDGLIITELVEKMPFEEVGYWKELMEVMEWSKTHVFSTFPYLLGGPGGAVLSLWNSESAFGEEIKRNLFP